MQHDATHCNTLHTDVQSQSCNTVQQTRTYCNMMQHTATHCMQMSRVSPLTHCTTLEHGATWYDTLQHTARRNLEWVLQHIATHQGTLQHAACGSLEWVPVHTYLQLVGNSFKYVLCWYVLRLYSWAWCDSHAIFWQILIVSACINLSGKSYNKYATLSCMCRDSNRECDVIPAHYSYARSSSLRTCQSDWKELRQICARTCGQNIVYYTNDTWHARRLRTTRVSQ